ncbi:Unknown protein [Striga hermonthica]|uniref:Uncharacterized protein n=1 Tax=Striga hermonthica TaxID=68872 RepID=A0A9N7ND11_STRHE|nr:Unknown protein [Striga hermonthica]
MTTGFSSSPIEVPRPCMIPEVEGLDNICLDTDSEKGKEVELKRRSKATTMPWTHEKDVLLCQDFVPSHVIRSLALNKHLKTSRGGKKARISDIGDHTSGSRQDIEPSGDVEDMYVRRPIGQKAAKARKRKGKTTAGGSSGPDVERLLAEIGEVKEIHLKKQKDLEKLVRIESWKMYREMLKEDTSTMTEEELQAHPGLLVVLKQELSLK